MAPTLTPPQTEWYKDNFLISTSHALLDAEAINTAFDSEALYWTRKMPLHAMKKLLEKSLCFGVYELPESTMSIAGRTQPHQIGLARLITDEVTFAWLTDVYILPSHQKQGLGRWLVKCVDEYLGGMKYLRRAMCVVDGEEGKVKDFYRRELGMGVWGEEGVGGGNIQEGKGDGEKEAHKLVLLNRRGEGSVLSI